MRQPVYLRQNLLQIGYFHLLHLQALHHLQQPILYMLDLPGLLLYHLLGHFRTQGNLNELKVLRKRLMVVLDYQEATAVVVVYREVHRDLDVRVDSILSIQDPKLAGLLCLLVQRFLVMHQLNQGHDRIAIDLIPEVLHGTLI